MGFFTPNSKDKEIDTKKGKKMIPGNHSKCQTCDGTGKGSFDFDCMYCQGTGSK